MNCTVPHLLPSFNDPPTILALFYRKSETTGKRRRNWYFMTMNLNWPVLNFALEEIMISGGVLMLQKLDKRVGYLAQFKKNKSLSPMIA